MEINSCCDYRSQCSRRCLCGNLLACWRMPL